MRRMKACPMMTRPRLICLPAAVVRLGMVLTEVGRTNNLQVTDEEKNRAVFQEAQRYPGQNSRCWNTSSRTRKPLSNWPDRSLKTR